MVVAFVFAQSKGTDSLSTRKCARIKYGPDLPHFNACGRYPVTIVVPAEMFVLRTKHLVNAMLQFVFGCICINNYLLCVLCLYQHSL